MPRRNMGTDPSIESFGGAIVGFTVAYIASESALSQTSHPIHWLLTLGGSIAGYAIGKMIYSAKMKSDARLGQHTARRSKNRPRRRPHQYH